MKEEKVKKNPSDAITHHLPQVDQWPASPQRTATWESPVLALLLGLMLIRHKKPTLDSCGQLPHLYPLPSSCAPPGYTLAGQHEKQRSPQCCASTAERQLKHCCVSNTGLVTSLPHSNTQDTTKKNSSTSASPTTELKTNLCLHYIYSSLTFLSPPATVVCV